MLHAVLWQTHLLHLDDNKVVAKDFDTYMTRLAEVFSLLRKADLKLKPAKCEIQKTQVLSLDHIVSAEGVATDPEIGAVKVWKPPKNLKKLQAFLGTMGYYRQYIDHYITLCNHCKAPPPTQ